MRPKDNFPGAEKLHGQRCVPQMRVLMRTSRSGLTASLPEPDLLETAMAVARRRSSASYLLRYRSVSRRGRITHLLHRLLHFSRGHIALVGADGPLVTEGIFNLPVTIAPERVGERHHDLGAGLDRLGDGRVRVID